MPTITRVMRYTEDDIKKLIAKDARSREFPDTEPSNVEVEVGPHNTFAFVVTLPDTVIVDPT